VFSLLELACLFVVATGAGFRCRHLRKAGIIHFVMRCSMACGAVYALFPHLPLKVLLYYARRYLLVTIDARALFRCRGCYAAHDKDKPQYE
jgi:hypothetical protein